MEISLRSPLFAILCSLIAGPVFADGHIAARGEAISRAPSQFELGGSVERSALAKAPFEAASQRRTSLSLPLRSTEPTRREADVFGITLFADEGWDDGRDAFLLGTAFTAGAATTGISVTYLDEGTEVSRSELYLDFAFNQNFSVGLSGILDNDFADDDTPTPQLGLNAAYATEGGAFFEGGISNTETSQPLFGVSIGLRF